MKNKNNTYNYQNKEYNKLYNAKPTNGRYSFPPLSVSMFPAMFCGY